jgi:N-methylhydantoinase A/oxoprolinase/acetone carboxylase beta subunit
VTGTWEGLRIGVDIGGTFTDLSIAGPDGIG